MCYSILSARLGCVQEKGKSMQARETDKGERLGDGGAGPECTDSLCFSAA